MSSQELSMIGGGEMKGFVCERTIFSTDYKWVYKLLLFLKLLKQRQYKFHPEKLLYKDDAWWVKTEEKDEV